MRRVVALALILGACGAEPAARRGGAAEAAPASESESEAASEPASAPASAPEAAPEAAPEPAPASDSESASEPEPEVVAASDGCPATVPDGMACVPGATITRGSDDGPENERPAAPVRVSTFLLDVLEVDNAHYQECVAAGICQRLTPFPGYMGATQPAVGMRWQDADAYCTWREKRLPTEAEFERAASGPNETRFPWGDEVPDVPCDAAIVRVREGRGCGTGVTWPVGSRPAGPWGIHDLAGNVWEWVADHYSWCYRGCPRECGDACFTDDPQGRCGDPHAECPESLGHRTVRGGSWWYTIDHATTTARRGVPGINPNPHRFGFRCALSASRP